MGMGASTNLDKLNRRAACIIEGRSTRADELKSTLSWPSLQARRDYLKWRFHSRDQHLCKCIGTKESVCIKKEFNSHRTGLEHQHGRRDVM